MNESLLQQNWALVAASVLVIAILIYLVFTGYRKTSRGQLLANRRQLASAIKESRKAQRAVLRAERRLEKLNAQAANIKPRVVAGAEGALADARALMKITSDQVLIAENHVRRVIHEEFSPNQHDSLRQKYLPSEKR